MRTDTVMRVSIVVPVFEDWESVSILLKELGPVLDQSGIEARVLLVNDGSQSILPRHAWPEPNRSIRRIDILHLRVNLGHQRAIATGLMYMLGVEPGVPIVVMDGDGEDQPLHVPILYQRFVETGGQRVIFAGRSRRVEGMIFRLFYQAYRWLHWLLVGWDVRVGNFSILPWSAVRQLGVVSALWNHYAAAVYRSRILHETILLPRGKRYVGKSKMHFVSLIAHGLSAISVFADIVAVRLLIAGTGLLFAGVLLLLLFGTLPIAHVNLLPGAVADVAQQAGWLLAHVILVCFVLAFLLLTSRSQGTFLPERDALLYIDRLEELSEYRG